MKFEADTLPGSCGVEIFYNFDKYDYSDTLNKKYVTQAGCGWVCAGFVEDDKVCQKMFKEMSNLYELVYRTPTRYNRNSGNQFFFAVFDTSNANPAYGFDANTEDGLHDNEEDDDD